MDFIGFNTELKDIWENNQNVFRYNGETADEWAASRRAAKESDNRAIYWGIRDEVVQNNYDLIIKNIGNAKGFPTKEELKMYQVASPDSLKQVIKSLPQLRKLKKIQESNGLAVGYDLETIGDAGTKDFAITEFGITRRQYQKGMKVQRIGTSLAFGLEENSDSHKFIQKAIKNYNTSGWNSLTSTEKFSLERASMYGHAGYDDVFEQSKPLDFLDNESHTVVKELGGISYDINTMQKGLANLIEANKNAGDTSKLFRNLVGYLESHKNQRSIIYSANGEFDVTGLESAAEQYKAQVNGEKLRNETVDEIYIERTVAANEGVSPETYHENHYGKRVGASVQNIMDAHSLQAIQTHRADSDTDNEGNVLDLKHVDGEDGFVDKAIKSVEEIQEKQLPAKVIREYGDDTLFLINKGFGFDKNKMDVASFEGDPDNIITTQSYSVGNEYWKIDQERTGYIDVNGQQKYILSMVNPVDPTIHFSVERKSEKEAIQHIQNNTTWVKEDQITKAQLQQEVEYKYQDMGRREFAKLIDPASVALSNDEAKYGFEELKKYLAFNDEFDNWLGLEENKGKKLSFNHKGIAVVDEFLKYQKSNTPEGKKYTPLLHGYYQKQAFIGMKSKFNTESKLLKKIVEEVEKSQVGQQGDNLINTAITKQSYDKVIKQINENHGTITRKTAKITMNDVFGVDIRLPEDKVQTVKAQKVKNSISDVSRIFSKLTIPEAASALNDLADRSVITQEDADRFASKLSETGNNHSVYTDIGYALTNSVDKYNDAENPIREFRENFKNGTDKTIVRPTFQETHNKNATKYRPMEGDRRRSITINDMFDLYDPPKKEEEHPKEIPKPKEFLNQISKDIELTTKEVPDISFVDANITNSQALTDSTRELARSLNIPISENGISSEHRLLIDMFNAKDKKKGGYKNYAINGYHDAGLRTFIVNPKERGNSAFMLLTNEKNMNKLTEAVLNGDFDFSSRNALIESGIHEYAGVYELPFITKYKGGKIQDPNIASVLGTLDYELSLINQSPTFEKFLMPKLTVYRDKDSNQIKGFLNNGILDYISAFRQDAGTGLEYAVQGKFEEASKTLRRIQDSKASEMSASSSYRSREIIQEDGTKIVKRTTNYNVNDYLHAFEFDAVDGLTKLFEETAINEKAAGNATAVKVIKTFGEGMGEYMDSEKEDFAHYTGRIMETSSFKEFFVKRLFHKIGEDGDIKDMIEEFSNEADFSERELNQTLFDVIRDSVNADIPDSVHTIYGGETKSAINKIDRVKHLIQQVLTESSTKKGIFSFKNPGDWNVNAGLNSTMRPVHGQQNNAMFFSPEMFTAEGGASKLYGRAPVMMKDEYDFKKKISSLRNPDEPDYIPDYVPYDPFGDGNYAKQQRMFMGRYKQMSDYELQLKYAEMDRNSASIAKEMGVKEDVYRQGLDYMRKDMMSLNEGKLFHSPELEAQGLFKDIEGEKIAFNSDTLDRDKTRKILNDSLGKEIKNGDVIGKTVSDTFIYHEGSTFLLNNQNINDLLSDDAITRVMPTVAQIRDVKLMLNGAEKGTSHSFNLENLVKHTSIQTTEEAYEIADKLFKYMSDGAAVVGNTSIVKHANNKATATIDNTIMTNYVLQGKAEVIANELNTLINAKDERFSGPSHFSVEDNTIIMDKAFDNPVKAYDTLLEKIKNGAEDGKFGDKTTNKIILEDLEYMDKRNLSYDKIQRQPQNEHMAKKMNLDQRIEQAIRNRSKTPDNYFINTPETRQELKRRGIENADNVLIADGIVDGMNGKVEVKTKEDGSTFNIGKSWDDLYADDLVEDARSFDGTVHSFLRNEGGSSNPRIIGDVVNEMNKSRFAQRIQRSKSNEELKRSIKGIIESVAYAHDNTPKNMPKNVVHINLENIKEYSRDKNITANDLTKVLFQKDGTPSEILQKIADHQDVDLKYSNSIRFDLNGLSFMHDGREYKDLLIPMQSVSSIKGDKLLYQTQQKKTAYFLRQYMDILDKPTVEDKDGNVKTTSQRLSSAYSEFVKGLAEEENYMKKDADMYKAYNEISLPNSSGYLAQDEIPMLVDDMMTEDMQKLISERNRLERELTQTKVELKHDKIKELDKTYESIDAKLKVISEKFKNGTDKPMEFTSLKATRFSKLSTVKIDDKHYYGYVAALNKEGFKAAGVDFGVSGLQLFDDLEQGKATGKTTFEGIDKLSYKAHKREVADKLNKLNINGLDIDKNKDIIPQVEAFFENYHKENAEDLKKVRTAKTIDTRTLNNAIERGDLNKVFGAFDGLSEEYLAKEGIFGLLQRYPAFSGQPLAKYVYDSSMDGSGLQMRIFNPVSSVFTNVDFDGDNLYSAFRLVGSTFLRKNSEEYQSTRKAYEAGVKNFNEALSELVLDGDAIKRDDVNFRRQQTSNILQTFRSEDYDKAAYAFAKRTGLDIENLTKAQTFALQQSDELLEAFYNAKLNTLTDEKIIIASLTPAMRKINIGSLSTPNFKIRSVIDEVKNQADLDEITKQQINTWTDALSNMHTKSGGLLTITEQKGIDVKHLVDAMNTAQTTKWSMGMAKLYATSTPSAKTNLSAMKDLLAASNTTMFKADKAELNKIANTIINTSFSDFEKQIKLETNEKELIKLKNMMAFRTLIEFQGIQGFRETWKRSLSKDTLGLEMHKFFEEYFQNYDKPEYTARFRGTVLQGLTESIKNFSSGEHIKFQKDNMYFITGTMGGDIKNQAFVYRGKGRFSEFDLEKNKAKKDISFTLGGSPEQINAQGFKKFNTMTTVKMTNFIQDEDIKRQTLEKVSIDKFRNILNDMVLDKDQVRKELNEDYAKVGRAETTSSGFKAYTHGWKAHAFGKEWQDMEKMFINKTNTPEKILANIDIYTKAYDLHRMETNSDKSTGADLLRAMNKEIARDRHMGNLKYESFDKYLEKRLLQKNAFGSADVFNRYVEKAIRLDGFAQNGMREYENAKDFLKNNLYDIITEEERLKKSFDHRRIDLNKTHEIRQNIQEAGHADFDATVKPLKDIMMGSKKQQETVMKSLRENNKKVAQEAQQRVYKLFKDEKQMRYFFNLNKATEESVVGFGEYLGTRFDSLSEDDIKVIKQTASRAKRELKAVTDQNILSSKAYKLEYHAVSETLNRLNEYDPGVTKRVSGLKAKKVSTKINKILVDNQRTAEDVFINLNEMTYNAKKTARDNTKRKAMGSSVFDSINNFDMKKLKGVGIVIGALAALGIANNLVHEQKTDSPLSPERKKKGNTSPNINAGFADGPQTRYKQDQLELLQQEERALKKDLGDYGTESAPQMAQAPRSPMSRTVYHDRPSGLNFKVTAKTKSKISDTNNARLIGLAGGGQAEVYSQSDTSGITDNWLANKFAELV